MPEVWRIAPGQQLAAWGWDDEFVVYNNLSGDTHLLDSDSYAILQHLQQGATGVDTLVVTFSEETDPDDVAALPAIMTDVLNSLRKLFLVESCADVPAEPC